MLIITLPACTTVEGPDSLYCGKWRKISKSHSDLDLDSTMPNIKLVRDIFIYYSLMFLKRLLFELSCKHGNTETHAHTQRL